jgi:hypothetical protein
VNAGDVFRNLSVALQNRKPPLIKGGGSFTNENKRNYAAFDSASNF